MKKYKYFLNLLLVPIIFIGFFAVFSTQAFALEPGCYSGGGSADRPTYSPTSCPTEGSARAVSQFDACFLVTGTTSVNERDCDDFAVAGTQVPESRSTSSQETEISVDCEAEDGELTAENCGIVNIIVVAINFLTAVAGMAIVGSIIIAGYQYMTARDNAGQIQKARQRIVWALTALAIMIFTYAILNFLVPGGVI